MPTAVADLLPLAPLYDEPFEPDLLLERADEEPEAVDPDRLLEWPDEVAADDEPDLLPLALELLPLNDDFDPDEPAELDEPDFALPLAEDPLVPLAELDFEPDAADELFEEEPLDLLPEALLDFLLDMSIGRV